MRRPIGITLATLLLVIGLAACSQDDALTGPGAGPTRISTPPGGTPGGGRGTLPGGRYVAITAGDDFTCVLTNAGTVYCWGRSDAAQAGEIPGTICNSIACLSKPTLVHTAMGDTLFANSIDAGANHACAIDRQNRAWCWGQASSGQLGLNQGAAPSEAILVPNTTGIAFYQISGGAASTCAQANTGLLCWGEMSSGLVSPVHWVSGDPSYTSVSVSSQYLCAFKVLGPSQNAVDCGGVNTVGQLGVDSIAFPNSAPFPTRSQFGTAVLRVSTGGAFTCADLLNGTVACAGDNHFGQLGLGTVGLFHSTPLAVGNGMQLHGVTAGADHACALDNSSRAWCWGNSDWGQVGNDVNNQTYGVFATPQLVVGGHVFSALAAGREHTCGINFNFLTHVSQILCWGINHQGQLGIGTTTSWFSSPVQAIDP